MARGLLSKALGGVGAAVQPVALEAMRASIMAERDARLQQYQTTERIAGQEFQQGERMATQEFQAGVKEKEREFEKPFKDAQAANLSASAAKTNAELKVIRDTEALYGKYVSESDPAKREQLSETIRVRLGKDQDKIFFGPLKDELGNITGYKAYSKITGRPIEEDASKPTSDPSDPLGLRGGKQPASASSAAPIPDSATQAQRTREALNNASPDEKARRERVKAERTSAEDAVITKETPTPKNKDTKEPNKKTDEQRLAELEEMLSAPKMSLVEGGLIKQAKSGRRFFGYAERKQLERERDMLRKKLGRE